MSRRGRRCMVGAAGVLLATAGGAAAEDWAILGGRARGMGGAGVALDPSPYWNPANAAHPESSGGPVKKGVTPGLADGPAGFRLGISAEFEIAAVGDFAREVDDVADFYFEKDIGGIQSRLNAGTATALDLQNMLGLIKQVQDLDRPGEGIYGTAAGDGYVTIQTPFASVTAFVRGVGYAGADPVVSWGFPFHSALADDGFADVFNTIGTGNSPSTSAGQSLSATLQGASVGLTAAQADELAFQAEQSGVPLSDPAFVGALIEVAKSTQTASAAGGTDLDTLFFNQSGFWLRGIVLKEGGISLAKHFTLGGLSISAGVTGKFIEAITNQNLIAISRFVDGELTMDKLLDDWNRSREVSSTFSVDAGLLVEPLPGVRVGISGRNLTGPVFGWEGPQSYPLQRQFRAGVALQVLPGFTFAADADLNQTETRVLDGYQTQMVGGGVEFSPGFAGVVAFAFRLGGYQNIAMPNEEIVYTLGLGIKVGPIRVDVGGAVTKANFDVESPPGEFDTKSADTFYDFEELYPERFGLSASITFQIPF